jgi:rhodanese-related sulfurtransferase
MIANAIGSGRVRQYGLLLLIGLAIAGVWNNSRRNFDIRDVTVPEARALVDAGALVIDVRDRDKSAGSHVPGAMLIPLELLASNLPKIEAYKDKAIVVYCGNGTTLGPEATQLLNKAGYLQAVNLKEGIEGWRKSGLPVRSS